MKRILTVLAILLILTLSLSGDVNSLSRPYDDPMIGPGGEDHPWGGEQVIDDPYIQSTTVTTSTTYITGIFGVDLLFKQFIISDNFRSWFIKDITTPSYRSLVVKDKISIKQSVKDKGIVKDNQ